METISVDTDDLRVCALASLSVILGCEISLHTVALLALAAVTAYSRNKVRLSRKARHDLAAASIPDMIYLLEEKQIINAKEKIDLLRSYSTEEALEIVHSLARAASRHDALTFSSPPKKRKEKCVIA